MKAVFINEGYSRVAGDHIVDHVFGRGRRERLAGLTELFPEIITLGDFEKYREVLLDVEVVFSTWGFPELKAEHLELMPRLKAVFYAAGATRHFRQPLLDRGIKVCSATAANAIPVAEFALSQILLAGAGYFRNSRECTDPAGSAPTGSFRGYGNFEERVAILGNGTVSKTLQGFLAHHDLEVVVVPSREAERTLSMEEAFATSFAVVNLFPDVDELAGIYNEQLFSSMMDSAVFINCGRGRQVNEVDLAKVMRSRPDLTALLDVQWPEPPATGSALYTLPNIQLSAHIAGAKSAELVRMADYMIDDFQRFKRGEPLQYEVLPDQL